MSHYFVYSSTAQLHGKVWQWYNRQSILYLPIIQQISHSQNKIIQKQIVTRNIIDTYTSYIYILFIGIK